MLCRRGVSILTLSARPATRARPARGTRPRCAGVVYGTYKRATCSVCLASSLGLCRSGRRGGMDRVDRLIVVAEAAVVYRA